MIPIPPAPVVPEDTEIGTEHLQKLLAKTLNVNGTMTPRQMAQEMKLPVSVVTKLVQDLQKLQFIEARGLAGGDMRGELRYALGGKGFEFVNEALAQSSYVGPAPVSLNRFINQIEAQSIERERLTTDMLWRSLSHLVLPVDTVEKIGPAFNSARSVLLYGEPGNGKTSIAEAAGRAFEDEIYIPYCFEVGGQTVNFYDPNVHEIVDGETKISESRPSMDPRWIKIKRPFVITGGELTLEMLDLSFSPITRFYEAPIHMKATGGTFVVDDFGRQRMRPQDVINRWIVPLERRVDHLTLHTGKKFTMPFDQLTVFSTNIHPTDLVDDAGLRRLQYKLRIPSPTPKIYRQIFMDVLEAKGIDFEERLFQDFYQEKYVDEGNVAGGHHPKYLMDFVTSYCRFKEQEVILDRPLLEAAWRNLVVSSHD